MKFARLWWMAALVLVLSAWPIARMASPTAASAQEPAKPAASAQNEVTQESQNSTPVIKTETRLVLVDTVVTDKKGNYLDNLTQKDFKVWEDDKEQTIKSFSVEAGAAAPNVNRSHYLVLFFDNSTMGLSDQGRARDAASKFIEANAGPDRYIALVEYTGTVHVAVNFTDDADKLRKAVKNMQFSIAGTPQVSHDDPSLAVTSMGDPTLVGGRRLRRAYVAAGHSQRSQNHGGRSRTQEPGAHHRRLSHDAGAAGRNARSDGYLQQGQRRHLSH